MRTRIKQIRKHCKKTQAEFGESLNVTKSTIQSYEYGECNITDRTIKDICRIYNVNETWLRTGDGEMFAPSTREQELADISVSLFKDNDFKSSLIRYIMKMNPDDLKRLELWLDEFSKFREEQKKPPTS